MLKLSQEYVQHTHCLHLLPLEYDYYMYPLHIKNKAIELRLKGHTYSEINKIMRLKMTKSTMSEWLSKVIISPRYKKVLDKSIFLKGQKARALGWKTNRKKREIYLQSLRDKNLSLLKLLDKNIQKLILCTLYLGEGAKYGKSSTFSLGSSDPKIIKLFFKLLRNCFVIDESKIRIKIQCRADQDINKLEHYWHKTTGIKFNQFYPTYVDKRTIGKKTLKSDYTGVCSVTYFDTSIQLELEILANSVIEYLVKGR